MFRASQNWLSLLCMRMVLDGLFNDMDGWGLNDIDGRVSTKSMVRLSMYKGSQSDILRIMGWFHYRVCGRYSAVFRRELNEMDGQASLDDINGQVSTKTMAGFSTGQMVGLSTYR